MGNKNIQGLPSVITKNWYPINPNGDVFKSKLTSECVREQLIKISNVNKIEQLKNRMKQNNPYISRVIFYYHQCDDIYYIYTDETRNRPLVHNLEQWKVHKHNIVQAFLTLAKRYGPTRVCSEMVGVDLNGQIKVWINPNPAVTELWAPCGSEAEMIADILAVLRAIGEESSPFKTKPVEQAPPRSHLFSSDFHKTGHHESQKHKNTNAIYRQSSKKLKLLPQKHSQKFIPHTPKVLKTSTTNLKISDSKTNSSENEKQKHDLSLQGNYFLSMTCSKDKLPHFEEGNFVWDRTRTEVFQNPFSKKGSRKNLFFTKNMSLKNKERSPEEKVTHLKSKMSFENQVNRLKTEERKNPESHQKKFKIWKQQNKNQKRVNSPIATDRSLNQSPDRVKKPQQRSLQSRNRHMKTQQTDHQKLSSRLGNVVYMPVRQQRESELTYTDFHDDRKKPHKKPSAPQAHHNQMSISQELLQFFDEEEAKEYSQVQNKIRKKSVVFEEFKKEFNQLFD